MKLTIVVLMGLDLVNNWLIIYHQCLFSVQAAKRPQSFKLQFIIWDEQLYLL